MIFSELNLPGTYIITPLRHEDRRGFFAESFRKDKFTYATGNMADFVQDNTVLSVFKDTIRGLHYQAPPHAQGKLVTCLKGKITDIIVDIRQNSPTYGQHLSVDISEEKLEFIWVPPGFAHGYITRASNSLVMYKTTDYYAPDCEGSIAWNDPELAIDWNISPDKAIVSDKDAAAQNFAQFKSPFK